jgi:predicted nucleic acid-binding protein
MKNIIADPDDNKFVDCAFATGADVIASEDSLFDVLRHTPFPYINVMIMEDFMHRNNQ